MKINNREQWLRSSAAILIDEIVTPVLPSAFIPPINYSLTAPKTVGANRVLGECWCRAASATGQNEIFITASLGETDSALILTTLLHEIIHAIDDNQSGHGAPFVAMARALGLQGGKTSRAEHSYLTPVASPALAAKLDDIIQSIGPIPHAPLTPALSGKKTQTNRQLLVRCDCCGFSFRASQKTIDSMKYNDCLACDNGTLSQI